MEGNTDILYSLHLLNQKEILFDTVENNLSTSLCGNSKKIIIYRRKCYPIVPLVSSLGKRSVDVLGLSDEERYGQKIGDDFFDFNIGHGVVRITDYIKN